MFCWWQIAEGFRKRALEGIKVVTYLQEFANVSNLSELSELFRDDDRLAEAAVRAYSHSISTFNCSLVGRMYAAGQKVAGRSVCLLDMEHVKGSVC